MKRFKHWLDNITVAEFFTLRWRKQYWQSYVSDSIKVDFQAYCNEEGLEALAKAHYDGWIDGWERACDSYRVPNHDRGGWFPYEQLSEKDRAPHRNYAMDIVDGK